MTHEKAPGQCPECGNRDLRESIISTPNRRILRCWEGCGATGTEAYFTPAVPERNEADAKVISRTFDVPIDRSDNDHCKSVNTALNLLIMGALEEGLELDWGSLRLLTSADGTVITYLAVIKGYPRAPVPVHDLGGVAVTQSDGKVKVIQTPATVVTTTPNSTTTVTYTATAPGP